MEKRKRRTRAVLVHTLTHTHTARKERSANYRANCHRWLVVVVCAPPPPPPLPHYLVATAAATNPLPRGECSFFLQSSAPDAYDYLYRRPEHVPNKGTM